MSQINLSKWLKAIIIGMAICGGIIYSYIIPFWGQEIAQANPEYAGYYWPWLIMLWITAIPCYLVLYFGWKIVIEIGKDNSFSIQNANSLKYISMLAAGDSVYFFGANLVFMIMGINHPGIFLISLFVVFTGTAVTVASAALSHLVHRAADIQEENELTI